MIPFLLTITTIYEVSNSFVPLKEYISMNAKAHCQVYFIHEDIPNFPRVNTLEKSRVDFFNYLDTIGIEHTQVGSYYFFTKKNK